MTLLYDGAPNGGREMLNRHVREQLPVVEGGARSLRVDDQGDRAGLDRDGAGPGAREAARGAGTLPKEHAWEPSPRTPLGDLIDAVIDYGAECARAERALRNVDDVSEANDRVSAAFRTVINRASALRGAA